MALLSNISYGVQLFAAELIFLYAFPRRRVFPPRIALALAAILAVNVFNMQFLRQMFPSPAATFAGLLLTIAVSILGMWDAFCSPFLPVLSACMTGVAVQHIAHHISRLVLLLPPLWTADDLGVELAVSALIYLLTWLTLGRWVAKKRIYEDNDKRIILAAVVIILICIGVTRLLHMDMEMSVYATIGTSIYAIICCALALVMQFYIHYSVRARSEALILKRINAEERRRYELSRGNAEQINIKYHDLKHKLLHLEGWLPREELDSMRALIDEYERTYDTGLDALDIVLNEKHLQCRERGISLTVMGDGANLRFMSTMDVYSLFGNLMDNAIEAVEALEPREKRQISLVLERRGEFVYISCINFMENQVKLREDGLLDTSKAEEAGYHGYGLRSIRAIVEKYQGGISISPEGGMFCLSIYMTGEDGAGG